MQLYDLCLAWNWEYDADFVHLLEAACIRQGLGLLQVTSENLETIIRGLGAGETQITVIFDRASESDERFQALVDWAGRSGAKSINPQEQTRWAADKATMHLEFISNGLDTPYTLLLSSCVDQPELPFLDLSLLGGSFAIKPAGTGGGVGVVLEANSLEQVIASRQQFAQEKYLLQAHVMPAILDGRPAWFRVLVCDGAVYPCWWDTQTHIYSRVTAADKGRFGLRTLHEIARRIAILCKLDLFSTEIALTETGQFLIVDYVNDPVDLRLQSEAMDGVPDAIVENIASRLVRLARKKSTS